MNIDNRVCTVVNRVAQLPRFARLRRLIAAYWQPIITFAAGTPAVLAFLSQIGIPVSQITGLRVGRNTQWLLIALGMTLLLTIRHPRIFYIITRFLLPPCPIPPGAARIFRGPLPYNAEDAYQFFGRKPDVDICWERLQRKSFFILEGESGCGKSSLLNTSLLPLSRGLFKVVDCRAAEDPFGRLRAALLGEAYKKGGRYKKEDIAEAVDIAFDSQRPESRRQILVCIDQFEEIFVTVKEEARRRFFHSIMAEISRGRLRLVIGIRSDFMDLLMKLIRAIDPDLSFFSYDRESHHVLQSFRPDAAEKVLSLMLDRIELHEGDPLREQQLRDFNRALVRELLRPSLDLRLCREDVDRILPVELQIVGWTYERVLGTNFSAAELRRNGGKLGLYRLYLDDALRHVFNITGIKSSDSLRILRSLISPAGTKWPQTLQEVSVSAGIHPRHVESVFNALAECYLVRRLTEDIVE